MSLLPVPEARLTHLLGRLEARLKTRGTESLDADETADLARALVELNTRRGAQAELVGLGEQLLAGAEGCLVIFSSLQQAAARLVRSTDPEALRRALTELGRQALKAQKLLAPLILRSRAAGLAKDRPLTGGGGELT